MKQLFFLLFPVMLLAACTGKGDKAAELAKLKQERAEIDQKIKVIESTGKTDSVKSAPVSVTELQTIKFNAFIEVHAQITGDENIVATPQAPGTVQSVNVQAGQKVSRGQVLATLDAATVDRQIETLSPQLTLAKSLYEKQEGLWKQNIGTEVQLMSSKAQYEALQKQVAAMQSQRNLYRVIAPISGTVDAVNLKVGDYAAPGMSGVRIVNYGKLKAEARLGENYLGKVKQGDPVTLILEDVNDTIHTALSYVSQAVDPVSRSFTVQVRLGTSNKLHPNMSCAMKIANYTNSAALVVPVSVIQNTSDGAMLYIADGNKAKAVKVTIGRNANGMVEILSGLSAGDKVITAGYESMENGQPIAAQ